MALNDHWIAHFTNARGFADRNPETRLTYSCVKKIAILQQELSRFNIVVLDCAEQEVVQSLQLRSPWCEWVFTLGRLLFAGLL